MNTFGATGAQWRSRWGQALAGACLLGALAVGVALAWLWLPPPTTEVAYLLVWVGERGPGLAATALGLAVGAGFAHRWLGAPRGLAWTTGALAVAAAAGGLVPTVQALRLFAAESLPVDLGAYLFRSHVERPRPAPLTLPFAAPLGRPLSLDVHLPPVAPPAGVPALVLVHGGGWAEGDKGHLPSWSAWLAQQGAAVFDIQHRLSPQSPWFAAVQDVRCAVGWVKLNAAKFQVDPSRVWLVGRSAGGHLSLLAAHAAPEAFAPSCEVSDTQVAGVVALYAPVDLAWGYSKPANPRVSDGNARLRAFLGGSPAEVPQRYRDASPLSHVRPGGPPTLLIQGERDFFVSPRHADFMVGALTAAGVRHRLLRVPYGQHGFDYVYQGLSGQLAHQALLRFAGVGGR